MYRSIFHGFQADNCFDQSYISGATIKLFCNIYAGCLYPNFNSTQTSCCNLLHNKHYEHRLHPEKLILVSMLWKTGDSTEILPQFGCSLSCRYKMESRLKHFIYYCLDLYRCFIYFRFMFRGLK